MFIFFIFKLVLRQPFQELRLELPWWWHVSMTPSWAPKQQYCEHAARINSLWKANTNKHTELQPIDDFKNFNYI